MKMDTYSVIFVEPENAGNVGSIARLMDNFELTELILVNPKCDIKSDECKALAKHSYSIIDKARNFRDLKSAVKDFDAVIGSTGKGKKDYDAERTLFSAKEIKKQVQEVEGKKAIVIGRESTGLSVDELALCDFLVKINTNPKNYAMNASHAAAIIIYELSDTEYSPIRKADKKDVEILLKQADELINSNERIRNKESVKTILRNVFSRSLLATRESYAITGFFKELTRNK